MLLDFPVLLFNFRKIEMYLGGLDTENCFEYSSYSWQKITVQTPVKSLDLGNLKKAQQKSKKKWKLPKRALAYYNIEGKGKKAKRYISKE